MFDRITRSPFAIPVLERPPDAVLVHVAEDPLVNVRTYPRAPVGAVVEHGPFVPAPDAGNA